MLKRIVATNFLSWQNLEFNFKDGVTLIEGWNEDDQTPEGSGKSAILNALCWGLYGAIPKDAKTDDVLREGAKSCSVEIILDNGVKIVRTRKPNDLYIQDPASTDKLKGKDAKETQTTIETLIGLSFETFCQAVYFAQNYPNKFVTANEVDKAKILSEIQDLSVFDKARKEAMTRAKALESDEYIITKDLSHMVQSIEDLDKRLKDFERIKAEFEKEKAEKIKEHKKLIAGIEADLKLQRLSVDGIDPEELQAQLKEIEADSRNIGQEKANLKAQLGTVSDKKRLFEKMKLEFDKKTRLVQTQKDILPKFNIKIEDREQQVKLAFGELSEAAANIKAMVKAAKNPDKSNCPTCGQAWSGDKSHFVKEMTKAKTQEDRALANLNQKQQDLDDLKVEKKKLQDEIIPQLEHDLEISKVELSEFKMPITENLEKSIADLSEMGMGLGELMTTLQSKLFDHGRMSNAIKVSSGLKAREEELLVKEEAKSSASYDLKINDLQYEMKAKLEKLEQTEEKLKDTRVKMNRYNELKQGFKDVKSFVFQGLLEELNRKTNRYLNELFEQPVKIKFNNQAEGGDVSKITVDVSIDGQSRPLGLYSGGQFRRIQLAVDLALADIVADRGTKPMRLTILDEYFKDLSEVSMEKVLHLLELRKGCVLLIEHNSIFKAICNQTFKVELVDGISRSANAN